MNTKDDPAARAADEISGMAGRGMVQLLTKPVPTGAGLVFWQRIKR